MQEAFDEPGSLMAKTIELLRNDERDLLQIHKDTNVPFYWLRELAAGKVKNPSVNRVQYLYEKLTARSLIAN